MPRQLSSAEVVDTIRTARQAAANNLTRTVRLRGEDKQIPYPYPSPVDWRDHWIYFLLLDRFNNPDEAPKGTWNRRFDFRQGGTFAGVTERLDFSKRSALAHCGFHPSSRTRVPTTGRGTITATAPRTSSTSTPASPLTAPCPRRRESSPSWSTAHTRAASESCWTSS
jgi:hypothetical protein